jgi:hypothetical protein
LSGPRRSAVDVRFGPTADMSFDHFVGTDEKSGTMRK